MDRFSLIDAHVHTSLSDDSQCPMEAYWALLEDGHGPGHWVLPITGILASRRTASNIPDMSAKLLTTKPTGKKLKRAAQRIPPVPRHRAYL